MIINLEPGKRPIQVTPRIADALFALGTALNDQDLAEDCLDRLETGDENDVAAAVVELLNAMSE